MIKRKKELRFYFLNGEFVVTESNKQCKKIEILILRKVNVIANVTWFKIFPKKPNIKGN